MDSLHSRGLSRQCSADEHTEVLSGRLTGIRKRYCFAAVLLLCVIFFALNFSAVIRMESSVDVGDDARNTGSLKHEVRSSQKIVLIITYARSGSTFTGSVFQAYPETFYIFEPFRGLGEEFKQPPIKLKYMNGTKRNYIPSQKRSLKGEELESWLNCRLDSLSSPSVKCGLNRHFLKYKETYKNCDKSSVSYKCLHTAKKSCRKTPLIALKIIRLRMKDVVKLLPFYPNMKIIHLVRDPRGVFNSRMHLGAVVKDDYKNRVYSHCRSMAEDLQHSKIIQKVYSNKLKILHYEDLAENPLQTARELIEFVGLEFLKTVKNQIKEETNSEGDGGSFSTQRNDSSETASKWRSEIDLKLARFIYDGCKTVNKALGYLPLLSEKELRNKKIPSRKKVR